MNNPKLILIVDDDPDYLEQLNIYVKSFGFNTITASSQNEAEQILQNTKPDLIITDLMMEKEDSGFILAYHSKKKYPDVPIIIVTAVSSETGFVFEIENSFEHNWIKADKYIEKGIRPDQLQREINKLLKI